MKRNDIVMVELRLRWVERDANKLAVVQQL
jgi:hypothetical protein